MKLDLRVCNIFFFDKPIAVIIILSFAQIIIGCAFKEKPLVNAGALAQRQNKMAFIPKDLKISDGDQTLSIIDSITLPAGDYQIDQTVPVKGVVEYPYLEPQFHETDCIGLGYTISYEPKRRGVTSIIKLEIYINGNVSLLDHIVASPEDKVQFAVYADYAPIADFVDKGVIPNEFVKVFEPSASCPLMCSAIRVKPVRPLIFKPGQIDCLYWIWGTGPDGYAMTTQTDDLDFQMPIFENSSARNDYVKRLQDCDAVRSNEDLKTYYQAATEGECLATARKVRMREWFFVEQKMPYLAPVYTISNLSDVIKNTSKTQTEYLKDISIHPNSDWLE